MPVNNYRCRYDRDTTASFKLTDRDITLLFNVFLLKAVRREHLERLHFTSVPRCNQRLRSLFDAGLLDRYNSPNGCVGPIVYSLGKAARLLVRDVCDDNGLVLSDEEFIRQCQRSKSGLLMHTLNISDVYVEFHIAFSSSERLQLQRFLPEFLVRQEFDIRQRDDKQNEISAWRQITVAPDGCFVLVDKMTNATTAALLEVDRGDTGSQITSKLHGYTHFIRSSLAAQVAGTTNIVLLFVTTGNGRAKNICLRAESSADLNIATTTIEKVKRLDEHATVWHVNGNSEPVSLIDVLAGSRGEL